MKQVVLTVLFVATPFVQAAWNPALSPNVQAWNPALSPNVEAWNPALSPNVQQGYYNYYYPAYYPDVQAWNPALSPNVQAWNPALSPNVQAWNPALSPNVETWNPALSPNTVQSQLRQIKKKTLQQSREDDDEENVFPMVQQHIGDQTSMKVFDALNNKRNKNIEWTNDLTDPYYRRILKTMTDDIYRQFNRHDSTSEFEFGFIVDVSGKKFKDYPQAIMDRFKQIFDDKKDMIARGDLAYGALTTYQNEKGKLRVYAIFKDKSSKYNFQY
ncbi:UNKNOWN [Stylonychia lemnae]|uniref:Uncharacterized protein n=1 Tax=Stylonychia lemnae TaxID=5949 RepID=A0A078B9U6_STYLE|nr:UNKNOWN [Stylonychia lemnae]|eukprot:CDW91290.1 UNKNOWN [Stylonychia lemnae]